MGARPTAEIFAEALLLPSEQRAAFLERACEGDTLQLAEITRLLAVADAHPEIRAFLGEPEDGGPLPRTLGRYRLESVIGRGGMGVVYRARDLNLDRDVAIKLVRRDLHLGAKATDDLRREAKTLASLRHPGVITVHDVDEVDGETLIAMEWLPGETLEKELRRGPLDWRRAADIALGIAEAVGAAHAAQVIHCDLKPSNVMLTDGRVKVLDFGIARAARAVTDRPDRPGPAGLTQRAGTPGYMSPEQTLGGKVDARSDVWGLGCVLHECLTGMPYQRLTRWGIATLEAAGIRAQIPRTVPRRLRTLVQACLDEDPERRPPSMAAFARQLLAILRPRKRGRWTLGLLLVLLAGSWMSWRFVAARREWREIRGAHVSGGSVFVDLERGSRQLRTPRGFKEMWKAAVVPAGTRDEGPLVVAGSMEANSEERASIVLWDGWRPVQALRIPQDLVFSPPETEDAQLFRPRFFHEVQSLHRTGGRQQVACLVCANYFPARFLVYDVQRSRGRDQLALVYRLDHEGHVSTIGEVESWGRSWRWIGGSAGPSVRRVMGGMEGATYFLALLPDSLTGQEVFPPIAGRSGAHSIVYFAIHACEVRGERGDDHIIWSHLDSSPIINRLEAGAEGHSLLLRTNLLARVTQPLPGRWNVEWSVTGEVARVVRARAARAGRDLDAAVPAFLADSVVVLLSSAPGIEVTGNFRDLRAAFGRLGSPDQRTPADDEPVERPDPTR